MAEEPNGWPSARRKPGVRASWDDVLQAEKMGRELLKDAEAAHEQALAATDEQHQIDLSSIAASAAKELDAANERWARLANEQEDHKAALAAELERAKDARAKAEAARDELARALRAEEANAATMRRLVVGALLESGLTMDDLMHPATPKETAS